MKAVPYKWQKIKPDLTSNVIFVQETYVHTSSKYSSEINVMISSTVHAMLTPTSRYQCWPSNHAVLSLLLLLMSEEYNTNYRHVKCRKAYKCIKHASVFQILNNKYRHM